RSQLFVECQLSLARRAVVSSPTFGCRISSSQTCRPQKHCAPTPKQRAIVHGAGRSFGEMVSTISRIGESQPLSLPAVTGAVQDRQSRIFGKARISIGEFATIECRSAIRLNSLCVHAIEAQ